MNTLSCLRRNMATFAALLWRDLYIFSKNFTSVLIDSIIVVTVEVLLFGRFFPLLGMPKALIPFLYLGSSTSFVFYRAYGTSLKQAFDFQFNRVIDYHITLPLPYSWLLAKMITFFVIETLVIATPVIGFGIYILQDQFATAAPCWPLFALVYILSLVFFGAFFLALSLHYRFDYFCNDIWPRRLSLIFCVSVFFVSWYAVYQFSRKLALLLLLNPTTYAVEAIRASIMGNGEYLSLFISLPMLCLLIGASCYLLMRAARTRLDPVS